MALDKFVPLKSQKKYSLKTPAQLYSIRMDLSKHIAHQKNSLKSLLVQQHCFLDKEMRLMQHIETMEMNIIISESTEEKNYCRLQAQTLRQQLSHAIQQRIESNSAASSLIGE